MKETKEQIRLRKIIRFIEKHPGCSTKEIAQKLDVVERTIQLDLKYLREHWREGELKSNRGRHTVKTRAELSKQSLEKEKQIYLKLATEALENLSDLSKHHQDISRELNLDKLSTPYFIKPESYEKLNTDKDEIRDLDEAIMKDYIIEFEFKQKRYHVEPYRLVNFDGIWYLYGKDIEEKEENAHKTWMLKYIDNVEVYYGETHDTPDEEIEEDLEEAHSAQFVVDKAFDVTVKISAEVADTFRQRNHLPNQNSKTLPDGSLLVTSTISAYEDIDPEIKSWLPHIEVLEPLEYKKRLREELDAYLKGLR